LRLVRKRYDPVTGFTDEFWYDDHTRRVTIRRLQDVEATLARNRRVYSQAGKVGYGDSEGLHHVAHIPFSIIEKWLTEGFNWYKSTDKERKAKLNHPDNRHLLVRPGKL